MERITYDQIFGSLVKSAYQGVLAEEMARMNPDHNPELNEYLKYASGQGDPGKVVFKVKDCDGDSCREPRCQVACLFQAIERDDKGNVVIKDDYCTSCGQCVKACDYECLVDKKEFIPLVDVLKNRKVPVYAIVAPAFIGQFGQEVTPGKLRAALKKIGFYGMVEVALFADMLTLKEALEFELHVNTEGEFLMTSCCCPMWVAMIRKVYNQLIPHISPSVSPMVACGRGVKKIHPEAKVVFIGPCVAKKAEAKETDIKDAVDVVLTFQELSTIFEVLGIDPRMMEEDESDHSSEAGRIYARTGGVSEAVAATLKRLRPERKIQINPVQADGIRECKKMIKDISEGKIEGNFFEGMGCSGGCVGGPKVLLDPGEAAKLVNSYGQQAGIKTPVDNAYVLELLKQLGFKEISELLQGEKSNMFKREFS